MCLYCILFDWVEVYGWTISIPFENFDVDCNTVVLPKVLFTRNLDKTDAGVEDVVYITIVLDEDKILPDV